MTGKRRFAFELRASTLALAAGFALSALPFAAQAAGLGKVSVFSALGQPLRAEIELSATEEELASMKASLASPEIFKAAGVDYASSFADLRFTIDQRPGSGPVIRLESDRPINDPFVDMLLELNWASGRLVREYTFLLDPPELMSGRPPVAPPALAAPAPQESRPAAGVESASPATPAAPPAQPAPSAAPPAARTPPAPAPVPEPAPAPVAASYEVKRGDTLRKIAAAHVHEGVSLERMLVGLYRANRDTFDDRNMNRLQSGRILTVPERSEVEAISEEEARKEIAVQAADWNAYRRRLAAAAEQAPASDGEASQAVAGRITPKLEEKAAPAAQAQDQVRVSRAETGEAALLAKDKALKEANERLALLERNVDELKKLLEMKNQSLAEMQKAASGAAPAAPKPVEPAEKTAEATTKAAEAKAAETKAPAASAPEKPEAGDKPAPAAEPKEEAGQQADAAPKPAAPPKPKPKVIPPPPPEEPGFVESLLEDPKLPAAGGGLIALLLAYALVRRRRAAAGEGADDDGSLSLTQSSLDGNSMFHDGGQNVDTTKTLPQTDFSQAGPGTIDTDEVDPVAEADVYMAYGRDAQAEEILLEAKAKDPGRHAIHLKLLEIYAARESVAQFGALATELHRDTGGVGMDWEKAAAMGRKLDPGNPFYGANASVPEPAPAEFAGADALAETTVEPAADLVSPEAESASSDLDFVLDAEEAPAAEPSLAGFEAPAMPDGADTPQVEVVDTALDFDFDVPKAPAESAASEPAPVDAPVDDFSTLDFDLPETGVEPAVAGEAVPETEAETAEVAETAETAEASPAGESDESAFDFDLTPPVVEESAAEASAPAFDMSSISLDLAEPTAAPEEETAPVDFDALPPIADPEAVDAGFAADFAAEAPEPAEAAETVENAEFEAPAPADLADFDAAFAEPALPPEAAPEAETADFSDLAEPAEPPVESAELLPDPINEEAATKLDLAKAYEEMGDFEGARELLQEVLLEGNAEQQAQAQASLERIDS